MAYTNKKGEDLTTISLVKTDYASWIKLREKMHKMLIAQKIKEKVPYYSNKMLSNPIIMNALIGIGFNEVDTLVDIIREGIIEKRKKSLELKEEKLKLLRANIDKKVTNNGKQ